MKMKKVWASLALVAVVAGVICAMVFLRPQPKKDFSVVATNFIGYDVARAVMGNGNAGEVKMLLKPGSEMHNYEPTPQDIIDISEADFFIYVGGESDEWVDGVLKDNNIGEEKTIRLMNFVGVEFEEFKEGMTGEKEEDAEFDEHIWTNPLNVARVVEAVRDRFIAKKPRRTDIFTTNAKEYTEKLTSINYQIRDIVSKAKRKELIFADRFPFRYLTVEYGLDYYAAFPGCAEQTEASSSTIAFLINKVKADNIPVILKIELTSDALAQTIANETGAKIMTLNSAHNISQEDFKAGKTYADIMQDNLEVLKEALN